jgi:polar amino acid transport system substrate-binding protein
MLLGLAACAAPATQAPATTAPSAAQTEPTSAPASAGAGKTFVFASDASFPPMEFVDDSKNIVGFDIDLINAIAKDQGFTAEFKNTAWDGIFAGLTGGAYDAIASSVTVTDDRKAQGDFSDPYINAGQSVVVRADESAIQSDKDLPGKTVGAQIETTGAIAVRAIEGANLKQYDTPDLGLLDLVNGNIDAFVVDTPVAANYALQSDQFKGKLKIVGQPFTDEVFAYMVQKGDPKGLLPLINAGLKNVKASGEYDTIYKKWIGTEPPK